MSQQRVEIWLDHLEATLHAARAYDKAWREMNADLPDNFNDLEFYLGPVRIECGGSGTGWSIYSHDDATYLVIESAESVDTDQPT